MRYDRAAQAERTARRDALLAAMLEELGVVEEEAPITEPIRTVRRDDGPPPSWLTRD
ncbi:hypothetical protein GCM10023147_39430 [Tsukamurella soli]|uniref:Uncharacterized protein n=2 Tax=Tsukamurella soli TaxID=644556 RepID=A0ABP8K5T8_9ACTN